MSNKLIQEFVYQKSPKNVGPLYTKKNQRNSYYRSGKKNVIDKNHIRL